MAKGRPDWRVYYDDGATFDSTQGGPEDVPAFGVICIVYPVELTGRQIMHGWDWYYWHPDEGQWWGSDIYGLLDRLTHRLPMAAVCQGRNVANGRFSEIMGSADKDPDFPPRGGKMRSENPHVKGQG